MKTLAERLRWLIDRRQTNQRTLGEKAGLGRSFASGYFTRVKRNPDASINADNLAALAEAWNVRPEWLMTGQGQPEEGLTAPGAPRRPPDQPSEATRFELALGRAFDPARHLLRDLRAVEDALSSLAAQLRDGVDWVSVAANWLDVARTLREAGHPVTLETMFLGLSERSALCRTDGQVRDSR